MQTILLTGLPVERAVSAVIHRTFCILILPEMGIRLKAPGAG
jgi:hypothetical protein